MNVDAAKINLNISRYRGTVDDTKTIIWVSERKLKHISVD